MKCIAILLLISVISAAQSYRRLFEEGRALYFKSRYEEAREKFSQAYAEQPEDTEVKKYYLKSLYELAQSALKKGEEQKAVEFLKKGIEIDEEYLDFYIPFIDTLIVQEKYQQAEVYASKAVKIHSENRFLRARAKELLGVCYYKLQQYDRAIEYVEKAYEESYEVRSWLDTIKALKLELKKKNKQAGMQQFDAGEYEKALRSLKEARRYSDEKDREIDSKILEINNYLSEKDRQEKMNASIAAGDKLYKQKKYHDAVSEYSIALTLGASEKEIQKRIQKCTRALEKIEEDFEKERERLILERKMRELREGVIYYSQNSEWKKAYDCVTQFLKHEPDNEEMLRFKDSIYEELRRKSVSETADKELLQGNYERALNLLQQCVEFSANPEKLLEKIAQCQKKLGKLDDAVVTVQRLHMIKPDNISYMIALAELYDALDNKGGALEFYEKAMNAGYSYSFGEYVKIGALYYGFEKTEKAFDIFHKAENVLDLATAKKLDFYQKMADFYSEQKNYDEALRYYKLAMNNSRSVGKPIKGYLNTLFQIWGLKAALLILNLFAVSTYVKWHLAGD